MVDSGSRSGGRRGAWKSIIVKSVLQTFARIRSLNAGMTHQTACYFRLVVHGRVYSYENCTVPRVY